MHARGSALAMISRQSSAVAVALNGTVIARAAMMPSALTCHSTRFSATSSTRSPGCTPSAISPRATPVTRAAVSVHDHAAQPSPSQRCKNGRGPSWRAR